MGIDVRPQGFAVTLVRTWRDQRGCRCADTSKRTSRRTCRRSGAHGAQLVDWELDDVEGVTVLLVSELMINAVTHARTTVDLEVAIADGVVEVGVGDRDGRGVVELRARNRLPHVVSDWHAENGRGLFLVDALSTEWGIEQLEGGKHVWFRRPVDEGWPYLAQCLCDGEEGHETVVLASGCRVKVPSRSVDDPGSLP